MTTIAITTTARRIARAHNACGPALAGGVLAFHADGQGGEWYSRDSRPGAAIIYPVIHGKVTERRVQMWLDEYLEPEAPDYDDAAYLAHYHVDGYLDS